MTHQELKDEKMEEMKREMYEQEQHEREMYEQEQHEREMYEQEQHERKMAEDSEYALKWILDANADDIDKAKELLNKVSKELFEVGIDIKDWELLKDYA